MEAKGIDMCMRRLTHVVVWMAMAILTTTATTAAWADETNDLAALRERVVALETTINLAKPVGEFAALCLVAVFAIGWYRLKKRVEELGMADALAEKIWAKHELRLTNMFDSVCSEVTARMSARNRGILLLGNVHKERVKAVLARFGYSKFVENMADADVAIFLGLDTCRAEHPLVGRVQAQTGRIVPVVLYTGTERIEQNENIIEQLNEISIAIPANTPLSAAQHAATLLMLTYRSPQSSPKTEKATS